MDNPNSERLAWLSALQEGEKVLLLEIHETGATAVMGTGEDYSIQVEKIVESIVGKTIMLKHVPASPDKKPWIIAAVSQITGEFKSHSHKVTYRIEPKRFGAVTGRKS